MRALLVCSLCAPLAACGGSKGGPDAAPGGIDAGPVFTPPAVCAIPDEGKPVDVSTPTTVVGTGTPDSCTPQALQDAVTKGGIVTFDCGAAPTTITLTSALRINNIAGADQQGDVVLDGGGTVTLSGNGTSRILYLNACEPPFNDAHCDTHPHPRLTVQHLTFVDGSDTTVNGGGAIFRHGGELRVIDCKFYDNSCAATGQDTSGGAIRLEQPTPALIVGSTFGQAKHGNQCSNGGAIGALQAKVRVIDSVFDSNNATGTGGNPGKGGNGGSIAHDGVSVELRLCGVQLRHSNGNAFGGGIFFVDNNGDGTVELINTQIDDANVSPLTSPSQGGGAYLQGAAITIANATVTNTAALFAGGLYVNAMNGKGSLEATNLTIAGVGGDALVIEDSVGTSTLLNSTIASNARALFGGGVAKTRLINSVIANNNLANCQMIPIDGGGNLQFPDATCGNTIATADPLLGALADNGGTTGVTTMAPGAGSPALGKGTGCPSIDARGTARPSTGCTSGAHQAP